MHLVYSRSSNELVAAPVPKAFLHAPGGGRVADAGAAVDVVGADDRADELLHQVVFLVGAAGRGNAGDGVAHRARF
jgi:hypothetical protein